MWIADAVEDNTLNKGITQDDVKDLINESETLEELKNELIEYFKIEDN